jgi:hypothetical protein
VYSEPDGWQMNQMYVDELEHFLQSVRLGSSTVNPVSSGLETLRVALAARQFAGNKHT